MKKKKKSTMNDPYRPPYLAAPWLALSFAKKNVKKNLRDQGNFAAGFTLGGHEADQFPA